MITQLACLMNNFAPRPSHITFPSAWRPSNVGPEAGQKTGHDSYPVFDSERGRQRSETKYVEGKSSLERNYSY
jgi:hypothetical protein